jgi:DNA-binding response OmpR family regulator
MLIAVLEDDPVQSDLYRAYLETAGHACQTFASARECSEGLSRNRYDLLLIDWMLPDGLGDQVIRFAREGLGSPIPIVVLTMRDDEANVVTALRSGADDYIVKPPRPMELIARIDALARRAMTLSTLGLQVGPYAVDLPSRRMFLDGRPIELTHKELELAAHLFQRLGRIQSRHHLLEAVWGIRADVDTRTVDTHVSRLRRKLQLTGQHGYRLNSIYGHGYRLEKS